MTRGGRSCHHYDTCGGLDWLETGYVEIELARYSAAVAFADGKISKNRAWQLHDRCEIQKLCLAHL